MEQRRMCANLDKDEQCLHATVKRVKTIKMRIDCRNVYCMHPKGKGKYIGPVEHYFPCLAPEDCPQIREQRKRQQALQKKEHEETLTSKLPIKNGKMTIAVIGQGRKSFRDIIKEIFCQT